MNNIIENLKEMKQDVVDIYQGDISQISDFHSGVITGLNNAITMIHWNNAKKEELIDLISQAADYYELEDAKQNMQFVTTLRTTLEYFKEYDRQKAFKAQQVINLMNDLNTKPLPTTMDMLPGDINQ